MRSSSFGKDIPTVSAAKGKSEVCVMPGSVFVSSTSTPCLLQIKSVREYPLHPRTSCAFNAKRCASFAIRDEIGAGHSSMLIPGVYFASKSKNAFLGLISMTGKASDPKIPTVSSLPSRKASTKQDPSAFIRASICFFHFDWDGFTDIPTLEPSAFGLMTICFPSFDLICLRSAFSTMSAGGVGMPCS